MDDPDWVSVGIVYITTANGPQQLIGPMTFWPVAIVAALLQTAFSGFVIMVRIAQRR